MKNFIKTVRWLFTIPLILILFILIITGITSSSISQTITKPSNLKSWLQEGKIYEKIPVSIPEILIAQNDNEGLGQMPLNKNDLTQISTSVLEPSWTQKNIEKVIDGSYLFLAGKTQVPTFEIDISNRKDILIKEASSKLDNQMGPGMSQQLRNELEKNELLSQDVINSAEFIKIDNKEVNKIQTVYAHLQKLPLYAIGLFLLISLILFLIVPQLHTKLRVLGFVWALPSLMLALTTLSAKNIIEPLYISQIQKAEVDKSDLILELVSQPVNLAIQDISSKALVYGIILTILGIILIAASYKLSPKKENLPTANSK